MSPSKLRGRAPIPRPPGCERADTVARSLGDETTTIVNDADPGNVIYTSTWVLVNRPPAAPVLQDASPQLRWTRFHRIVPPWTDDYGSLLKILK
jgi:hypothetical protein